MLKGVRIKRSAIPDLADFAQSKLQEERYTPIKLDYPNYMPFSDRAMTFYCFAMRGRGLMKPDAKPDGRPVVYFDDVSGGPISREGTDSVAFRSGFEEQQPIGEQPVTVPVIDLGRYKQGRWYLERKESIFSSRPAPFARSGERVGVADASID